MPKKYRRRRYKKSAMGIAKKALTVAKKATSAIEKKHFDFLWAANDFDIDDLAFQLYTLNEIPQGLDDTARVGDKLKMIGLRLHFAFEQDNQASSVLYRCILMYDKENTLTNANQFLLNPTGSEAIYSPHLVDQRHKYQVLHDRIYATNVGYKRKVFINMGKKMRKFTQFNAGTTTITRGALKLWLISDYPNADVNPPVIREGAISRVWYQDA